MADTAGSAGEVRVRLALDISDLKTQITTAENSVGKGQGILLKVGLQDPVGDINAAIPDAKKLDRVLLTAGLDTGASISAINEALKEGGGIQGKTKKIIVPIELKMSKETKDTLALLERHSVAPRVRKATAAAAAVEGKWRGGHVQQNKPYVVGERGPEVFVPYGSSGRIIPSYHEGGPLIRGHIHNDKPPSPMLRRPSAERPGYLRGHPLSRLDPAFMYPGPPYDGSYYRDPRTGRWHLTEVRTEAQAKAWDIRGRTRPLTVPQQRALTPQQREAYEYGLSLYPKGWADPYVAKVTPREKGQPRDLTMERMPSPERRFRRKPSADDPHFRAAASPGGFVDLGRVKPYLQEPYPEEVSTWEPVPGGAVEKRRKELLAKRKALKKVTRESRFARRKILSPTAALTIREIEAMGGEEAAFSLLGAHAGYGPEELAAYAAERDALKRREIEALHFVGPAISGWPNKPRTAAVPFSGTTELGRVVPPQGQMTLGLAGWGRIRTPLVELPSGIMIPGMASSTAKAAVAAGLSGRRGEDWLGRAQEVEPFYGNAPHPMYRPMRRGAPVGDAASARTNANRYYSMLRSRPRTIDLDPVQEAYRIREAGTHPEVGFRSGSYWNIYGDEDYLGQTRAQRGHAAGRAQAHELFYGVIERGVQAEVELSRNMVPEVIAARKVFGDYRKAEEFETDVILPSGARYKAQLYKPPSTEDLNEFVPGLGNAIAEVAKVRAMASEIGVGDALREGDVGEIPKAFVEHADRARNILVGMRAMWEERWGTPDKRSQNYFLMTPEEQARFDEAWGSVVTFEEELQDMDVARAAVRQRGAKLSKESRALRKRRDYKHDPLGTLMPFTQNEAEQIELGGEGGAETFRKVRARGLYEAFRSSERVTRGDPDLPGQFLRLAGQLDIRAQTMDDYRAESFSEIQRLQAELIISMLDPAGEGPIQQLEKKVKKDPENRAMKAQLEHLRARLREARDITNAQVERRASGGAIGKIPRAFLGLVAPALGAMAKAFGGAGRAAGIGSLMDSVMGGDEEIEGYDDGGTISARQRAPYHAAGRLPALASIPGAILVGEHGPEVIVPGASGGIVFPNHWGGDPRTVPGLWTGGITPEGQRTLGWSGARASRHYRPTSREMRTADWQGLVHAPEGPTLERPGARATPDAYGAEYESLYGQQSLGIPVSGRRSRTPRQEGFDPLSFIANAQASPFIPSVAGRMLAIPAVSALAAERRVATLGGRAASAAPAFSLPGAGPAGTTLFGPLEGTAREAGRGAAEQLLFSFVQGLGESDDTDTGRRSTAHGKAAAGAEPVQPMAAEPNVAGPARPDFNARSNRLESRATARQELFAGGEGLDYADQIAEIRSKISEQLSLTPVRALSVSVGQILQQAVGGRAGIQARAAQANVAAARATREQGFLEQLQQEEAQARFDIRRTRARVGEDRFGSDEFKEVREQLQSRLEDAIAGQKVQEPVVEEAIGVAAAREKVVSTRGQRFKSQALGVGGIVAGTLIFSNAMKLAQLGISGIEETAGKMADAMSDFTVTTNRVSEEMSKMVGAGGVGAGTAFASRFAQIGYAGETPALERRAQMMAGSENIAAIRDLIRADENAANRRGIEGVTTGFNDGPLAGLPVLGDLFSWVGQKQGITELLHGIVLGETNLRSKPTIASGKYDLAPGETMEYRVGEETRMVTVPFGGTGPEKTPAEVLAGDVEGTAFYGTGGSMRLPGLSSMRDAISTIANTDWASLAGDVAEWEQASSRNQKIFDQFNIARERIAGLGQGGFQTGFAEESEEVRQTLASIADLDPTGALSEIVKEFGVVLIKEGEVQADVVKDAFGRVISSSFTDALEEAELGSALKDFSKLIEEQRIPIEAQLRGMARAQEFQEAMIPAQYARTLMQQPLAAPTAGLLPSFGGGPAGIFGGAVPQAGMMQGFASEIGKIQEELDAFAESGMATLSEVSGVSMSDLRALREYAQVTQDMRDSAANLDMGMEQERYNEQLRISRRGLSDIVGLAGKLSGTYRTIVDFSEDGAKITQTQVSQASEYGQLQRAQMMDQRQLSSIQLARSQRELNLQLALSRLRAPGETAAERAVRRREAEMVAKEQQRELNIGRRSTQRGWRIQDIDLSRQLQDALRAQGLSESERVVQFQVKGMQQLANARDMWHQTKLSFLDLGTQFGTQVESAMNSAQTTAEAASGQFLKINARQTRRVFNEIIENVERAYDTVIPSYKTREERKQEEQQAAYQEQFGRKHETAPGRGGTASGGIFSASSATNFIAGEAGSESVVVIRNPKLGMVSGGGGGGGGGRNVTININASVRDDRDVDNLVKKVIREIHQQSSLMVS